MKIARLNIIGNFSLNAGVIERAKLIKGFRCYASLAFFYGVAGARTDHADRVRVPMPPPAIEKEQSRELKKLQVLIYSCIDETKGRYAVAQITHLSSWYKGISQLIFHFPNTSIQELVK